MFGSSFCLDPGWGSAAVDEEDEGGAVFGCWVRKKFNVGAGGWFPREED